MSTGYITATIDTVRRKYVGSECVVTITVYNSAGTATTPTDISFKWRNQIKNAAENSVTLANTGTGTYTATFTPDKRGVISYRIKSTTPTAAFEGALSIADTKFAITS